MSWPQWQQQPPAPIPAVLPTAGAPPPLMNSAPSVIPSAYTQEQWAQLQQQNWQQWAQWQQQYQQWHQQYGAEYQKSMSALAQQQQTVALPNMAVPPPLPVAEVKPPPPNEPPPAQPINDFINNTNNNYSAPPLLQSSSASSSSSKANWQPNNQNQKRRYEGNDFVNNKKFQPKFENQGPKFDNQIRFEPNQQQQQKLDAPTPPFNNNSQTKFPVQNKVDQPLVRGENPDDLSEAEKKFDKQFAEWEAQFQKWKEQNAEHPDKEQYLEYEKKWERWRAQLLERREQMKRKRLESRKPQSCSAGPSTTLPPPGPSTKRPLLSIPPEQFSKPPSNVNDEPALFKDEGNNFLKSSSGESIPGLDLVKEETQTKKLEDDVVIVENNKGSDNQTKGPDFEAISKGINSILGDSKLMNMLSIVSSQQNLTKPNDNVVNTVSRIKDSNDSNISQEEQSNHSFDYQQRDFINNFDDQTRLSFTQTESYEGGGNFKNDSFGRFPSNEKIGIDERPFIRGPSGGGNFGFANKFTPPKDRFRRGPSPGLNNDRFGINERFIQPPDRYPNDKFQDSSSRYPSSEGVAYDNRFSNDRFPSSKGVYDHRYPNDRYQEPIDKNRFSIENDSFLDCENRYLEPVYNERYPRDNNYLLPMENKGPQQYFEPQSIREDKNLIPEPKIKENIPPVDDDIWKPNVVKDYEHKSSKPPEPEILVEPIFMFDYRHKPLSRIPLPQRPKWLVETVKNIREFDPPTVRPFENLRARNYPIDRRDDWRIGKDWRDRRDDWWDRRDRDDFRRDLSDNFRREEYDNMWREKDDKEWRDKDNYRKEERREKDDWREKEEHRKDEWREGDNKSEKRLDKKDSSNRTSSPGTKTAVPPPASAQKNTTMIDDILCPPGRYNRPPRIVIILRGPPGSGKTHLAKLIKDKEIENGGSAPRILSLDDYFMVEHEKEIIEDGKKIKIKEMIYEYEADMEENYRNSLVKSFKKTVTDGYFSFIIVDNVNDKIKYFGEMWSFAKQNGFQVYVCQMDLDVQLCSKRNIHGRSEEDIQRCVENWEPTPCHHPVVDARSLIQSEAIPDVEMEEVNSPENMDDDDDDDDEDEDEHGKEDQFRSKWDNFDCSVDNLAKLDGVNKPLRTSRTIEEYLQLDSGWTPTKPIRAGQKRVRWADLEEQKQQEKMRAIGFVVGQTDWDRMLDPSKGSSALTQTKYIDESGRY